MLSNYIPFREVCTEIINNIRNKIEDKRFEHFTQTLNDKANQMSEVYRRITQYGIYYKYVYNFEMGDDMIFKCNGTDIKIMHLIDYMRIVVHNKRFINRLGHPFLKVLYARLCDLYSLNKPRLNKRLCAIKTELSDEFIKHGLMSA
jgi:hypothetical protein